ncbi:unnamed protein product [Trichobilharzia regenti]|nr:unnamed protein product [Trichobilharzia regenti]
MVNDKDYVIVVETSEKARESALGKSETTQIKKLNKLIEEKNTISETDVSVSSTVDRTKWLVNLSSRELSSSEIKVLEKGPNFNVAVSKLKPEDVIPNIEVALGSIDKTNAEVVLAQCALTLKNQKKTKSNLTKSEREALISLKQDKNIVIAKVDKGNDTVVLNKSDFIKKVTEHIQTGPYEEIKKPVD